MIVLLPVLGGLALISMRGKASSASTVAPSARPAASAFASAYISFLNGRLAAAALPDATAAVRTLASSGGRVPAAYQGKLVFGGVRFSGVLGARRANAGLIARAGSHTLEASIALAYAGGRWQVTTLVPPDFSTVFSPANPPVSVSPAVRAAARSFALAYADYRTGASARPPEALPAIERQLAAGQDPLAGTSHSRSRRPPSPAADAPAGAAGRGRRGARGGYQPAVLRLHPAGRGRTLAGLLVPAQRAMTRPGLIQRLRSGVSRRAPSAGRSRSRSSGPPACLLLAALVAWQLALAGWSAVGAANAARTAARSYSRTGDAASAQADGQQALKDDFLGSGSSVHVSGTTDARADVVVSIPIIVPGITSPIRIPASADMPKTG